MWATFKPRAALLPILLTASTPGKAKDGPSSWSLELIGETQIKFMTPGLSLVSQCDYFVSKPVKGDISVSRHFSLYNIVFKISKQFFLIHEKLAVKDVYFDTKKKILRRDRCLV